jgi:flagellar motility protein MotE (MotC chaperone)
MTRLLRDLRPLPIAVVASACLLALIAADLVLGGGGAPVSAAPPPNEAIVVHTTRSSARPQSVSADPNQSDHKQSDAKQSDPKQSDQKQSWAQMMFNFPNARGMPPPQRTEEPLLPPLPSIGADKNNLDITGSVPDSADKSEKGEKGKGAAAATGKDAKEPKEPPKVPDGQPVQLSSAPGPSGSERAILEHLQERRQELDKRARELDIREGLIAEAEKRVENKLNEIKSAQGQLKIAEQKKDEAEIARFKGLVTMYETMKPRDAAKIFDRLEVGVLLQVASQINPRNMAEILAQMSPDRAEKLTVELASRAQVSPKGANADLPKIEGRPRQ